MSPTSVFHLPKSSLLALMALAMLIAAVAALWGARDGPQPAEALVTPVTNTITLSPAAAGPVQYGDLITLTWDYQQHATIAAIDLILGTDGTDLNHHFEVFDFSGAAAVNCTGIGTQQFSCNPGALGANATTQLVVRLHVVDIVQASTHTSGTTISAGDFEAKDGVADASPVAPGCTGCGTYTIQGIAITDTKTDSQDPVFQTEPFSYQIVLDNDSTTLGVDDGQWSDTIPSQFTILGVSSAGGVAGTCDVSGQTVRCGHPFNTGIDLSTHPGTSGTDVFGTPDSDEFIITINVVVNANAGVGFSSATDTTSGTHTNTGTFTCDMNGSVTSGRLRCDRTGSQVVTKTDTHPVTTTIERVTLGTGGTAIANGVAVCAVPINNWDAGDGTLGFPSVATPAVAGDVNILSGTATVSAVSVSAISLTSTTVGTVSVNLDWVHINATLAVGNNTTNTQSCAFTAVPGPTPPLGLVSIPDPDHWNIIGSDHTLCIVGFPFDGDETVVEVSLTNQFGANAAWTGDPPTFKDVDGDLIDDMCITIRSTFPGETVAAQIRFFDPDLGEFGEERTVAGFFIKEWSELTDSVIIRVPASWSGVDDQGIAPTDDFTKDNHIDDIDWQHNNDIQGTTITSDVTKTIRIIEISHGEHETGAAAEFAGFKSTLVGGKFIAHVDVDHADVTVKVTSPRGCTSAEFVSDGHSVTSHVHSSGEVESKQIVGTTTRTLDHGGEEIAISAICEELATITITEAYPNPVSSAFNKVVQTVKVNWTTVEEAKQPVIRKAGEEIILETRWSSFVVSGDCTVEDELVVYTELSGPGALLGGYENLGSSTPDFIPSLFGGDIAIAEVDADCISAALYSSEDPGEVDVEAILCDVAGDFDGLDLSDPGDFDCDGTLGDNLLDKHAFLVWYVKLYSVNVSNVAGSLTSAAGDKNGDGIIDATEGSWSPTPTVWDSAGTDKTDDTLVVSDYALIRVQVKDYLYLANNSGRQDVCLDMDGDGDEAGSTPGEPYGTVSHAGCVDSDDEILAAGYWVLPDDFPILAGAQPNVMRKSWDVLCGPGDTACSGAGLIGPKRLVDTHDGTLRDWVTYSTGTIEYKVIDGGVDVNGDGVVDGDDDGFVCGFEVIDGQFDTDAPFGSITSADDFENVCGGTFDVINGDVDTNESNTITAADDGTLKDFAVVTYKSIAPNGVVNIWDAIMPLEKITLSIGATDAGTLFAVDKDAVYGANNPYFRVFIPAHDLIPATVSNGGYDWDSTFMGPYGFWDQLQFRTLDTHGHVKTMEVYTDNRGEGMALLFGDADLNFDACAVNISGTPDCEPGDVVGITTVTAIADYPYFRKHRDIQGNEVTKTWEWGGYKRITVVPLDPTHTRVVAHLLDRDGECDAHWDGVGSGVRHEPVEFTISGDGVIDVISAIHGSVFIGVPAKAAIVTAGDATDFGGALPFADAGSADECQAWILVEHGSDADVQVSILFPEPEGDLIRSVEFPLLEVKWGDVDCDGDVDIGDAQKIARWLIDLSVSQTEPCPDIGSSVSVTENATTTIRKWGDVDGDGDVDIGDAQKIARWLIDLEITQTEGTPEIGDTVHIPS